MYQVICMSLQILGRSRHLEVVNFFSDLFGNAADYLNPELPNAKIEGDDDGSMRPTLINYLMEVQFAHRLDSIKQERSEEKKAQLAALEEEER